LKELVKEVNVATKSAMASGNKSDEVKKLIDLLSKRVVKLER
jgi:hypothetical protein